MAHRGGSGAAPTASSSTGPTNLYSQFRDEVEIVEEEPDLSLFQIGMSHTPSYASSYAEEVSIEQHMAEVASFRDETSVHTGAEHAEEEEQITDEKSRKSRSRKSSADSPGCGARICRFLGRYKWTITFLLLVAIGVSVALSLAVNKTNEIVKFNRSSNPKSPFYVEQEKLDQNVLASLKIYLKNLYHQHSLDASVLEDSAGENAARFAMFWMASDPESNINVDDYEKRKRFVLATFYYATNMVASPYAPEPRHWRSATGWLTIISACDWRGIRCDEQGKITRISMERNRLSGALPFELAMLADSLHTLDLTSNLIWMEGDAFNIFEKLENLEYLYMDDNFLVFDQGLPPQLGTLSKLKRLRLSYNLLGGQLEGSHPILEGLTQLTHLELESNFFNGTFPGETLGRMDQLVYIYMRRNDMQYNLDWLSGGRLTNLFSLWLESQGLTGTIPNDIGLLTNLASLSLTDSRLTGTIPASLGDLTGLRRLWLYGNQLQGEIPETLENLPLLELAEFHNNSLWGDMPQGVCNNVASNAYEHMSLTSDCLNPDTVRCDDSTCCTECF